MSSCEFQLSGLAHSLLRWRSQADHCPHVSRVGLKVCIQGPRHPGQGVSLGGAGRHGLGSPSHMVECSGKERTDGNTGGLF